MAKQKYIGEFPHDIRQLANILWENKNILANINCFSPIGKYRPDIRHWRMYRWRNAILAKLHRLCFLDATWSSKVDTLVTVGQVCEI
jgi:hypothetical protein